MGSAAARTSNRRVWRGQRIQPREQTLLDAALERQGARQGETAGHLLRAQRAWELPQGQRVAPRLGDQLVADSLVDGAGECCAEQLAGVVAAESLDGELWQVGEVVVDLTHGQHDSDAFRA